MNKDVGHKDQGTPVGTKDPSVPTDSGHERDAPNQSRRRLAQAGLAAPLMVSLAARPVWGSQGYCSWSGFMSANVSNIDHECGPGDGCTPGFWKNNWKAWGCVSPISPGKCTDFAGPNCKEFDATATAGATTFASVFGVSPLCLPFANATLMEVLQLTPDCQGELDWHAVAAFLNATCGLVHYGTNPETIIDLYREARGLEAFYGTFTGSLDHVTPEDVKDLFEYMNERGCPINAFGDCDAGYSREEVGETDKCIKVKTSMDY